MRIAITGIIGSGKSTVINLLKEVGEFCVSCDEINSQLLLDSAYINKLQSVFPSVVVGGAIDKVKLAKRVFGDNEAIEILESIAHPLIMDKLVSLTDGDGLYFCEVPTLNSIYAELFDEIWYVDSQEDVMISRVRDRDGLSEGEVLSRLRAHDKYRGIKQQATLIIHNDSDLSNLKSQVYGELGLLKRRFAKLY
ncbi:MAG: dephospho-CoA kinase [Clostridia bacterium]|nr:dephospho-CoA kinase [Clostridia bacterium]